MATYWEDVDPVWERAVAAGAEVVYPLADQFYGERGGRLRDPFGQQWMLSQRIEELSPGEIESRAAGSIGSRVFRPAGISYLQIPAKDPQKTAAFYQSVFGWTVDTTRPNPSFEDGTGHVIGHFIRDADVAGEAGVRPYVYVESVDDTLDQVSAHGGAAAEAPYPEGDLWVASFRDPAGNVVGVWQRGPRGEERTR